MPDWTRSMQQTYEYYIVDPDTWLDVAPLDNVRSCSIDRDEEKETLETASIECDTEIEEAYVRCYLITEQDGIREKTPLGTFLIQSPTEKFDGKVKTLSIEAYSPLLEWKDDLPPLGYSVCKNSNVLERAWLIGSEHIRAPIVPGDNDTTLYTDFVAESDDTWLSFFSDLVANAGYKIALDELSRIIFAPIQDTSSLMPIWTYSDDNSSILYPDLNLERDLYGIPNVVEVLYSDDNIKLFSRIENNDPESPISTVSRGRMIIHRDTNPDIIGNPTQARLNEYAENLLRNLSSFEYRISYRHGYCPVRVGDCVLLDYRRAGLFRVKAKVISQSISCESGCPVDETAVYTINMWEKEEGA